MGKERNNSMVRMLAVTACLALLCLIHPMEGSAGMSFVETNTGTSTFRLGSEELSFDLNRLKGSRNKDTKIIFVAECDKERMLAPEGGSVWDKALANPNYQAEGSEDTNEDSDSDNGNESTGNNNSGSGGESEVTGGREVDPDRDVEWGDGTVTPDAR